MDNINIDLTLPYSSLLRIEGLLEELIWQQILIRKETDEDRHKAFEEALKNVSEFVKSAVNVRLK